jgi:hypothetical protein
VATALPATANQASCSPIEVQADFVACCSPVDEADLVLKTDELWELRTGTAMVPPSSEQTSRFGCMWHLNAQLEVDQMQKVGKPTSTVDRH